MTAQSSDAKWYTVRCIFRRVKDGTQLYEERLTLWQARDIDQAIALAEKEAARYGRATGAEYLKLAQAYWLPGPAKQGAEVFSLIRQSDLEEDDYLDQFFDTGTEHQRT